MKAGWITEDGTFFEDQNQAKAHEDSTKLKNTYTSMLNSIASAINNDPANYVDDLNTFVLDEETFTGFALRHAEDLHAALTLYLKSKHPEL